MVKGNPIVSVVVTTKNEEKNIGRCLESIKNQTYPKNRIEIIVVDNNSTDRTKEIAKKYTKLVFDKGPERSAQRNSGIKRAKGEYILFLDADMSLSPKIIEECVKKFKDNKSELVGLYIPERILGDSYWCKVRDFERSFYNGTVIDAVRFFPKYIWEKVGGFDEDLTGPEDWDFDKKVRMKGETDIISLPIYHNETDFNFKEYLKGKSYYSRSFDKYIKKWGPNDSDIRKQFGFCYRYFVVYIENGEWKNFFRHPFLMIGLYLSRILVGIGYLNMKVTK
jgi:glycosyltransferase involved in cell wall biosynthesis